MEYDKTSKYGMMLLETWNIFPEDKVDILEEKYSIEYLVQCKYEFAKDGDMYKPPKGTIMRAFTRHLNFIELIYGNKIDNQIVKKEYETCSVYLNLMKDNIWYDSLPDVILKLEGRL